VGELRGEGGSAGESSLLSGISRRRFSILIGEGRRWQRPSQQERGVEGEFSRLKRRDIFGRGKRAIKRYREVNPREKIAISSPVNFPKRSALFFERRVMKAHNCYSVLKRSIAQGVLGLTWEYTLGELGREDD